MSQEIISARDITVRLSGNEILRSVSLDIREGSCTAILGPNGAGKTTLLKCLNRLLEPESGTILLDGRPLSGYAQKEIAHRVAYVPQAGNTFFAFTVYEFVSMGRYPHLSPFSTVSAEDKRVVDEVLEITGTEEFRDRRMETLSGGERQSVFIAAALAQGGNVLLMDEPTTYLDYKHQIDVLALVRRLNREQGLTIVLVTHDVNQAMDVCDHVVALKEGRKIYDGDATAFLGEDELMEVFDTSFRFTSVEGRELPLVSPKGDES